jgi:D-glycero-alpha-D-manno-heptose-7-phosphate kinase
MIIEAKAPVRIDFAGGAFDVHPLYLFEGGGVTVNAGIDLYTEVRLETRDDSEMHLRSIDLDIEESARDVDSLDLHGELGFIARLLKFYRPATGLNVTTRINIPKGSGLGTSSSLLISLTGALDEFNQTGFTTDQMIDYGANIEAQSLCVPTGKQDYFGACYGWFNAIWSEIKGCRNEQIPLSEERADQINECLVLSFTGQPRFSGATNWDLVKGYIDDVGDTRQVLRNIQATGFEMCECFRDGADEERLIKLLRQEWENRKRCAPGVTNPDIEKLMADAEKAGALAGKLCGAGGGGCMISYVRPEDQDKVIASLEANGARHMPYRFSRKGLTITRS